MKRTRSTVRSGVELNMTPMIDVVFQLLAFFLMTFRVSVVEGDFELRLPAPDGPNRFDQAVQSSERIVVRIQSDERGEPVELLLDSQSIPIGPGAFNRLRVEFLRISAQAQSAGVPLPTLEITADDRLQYEFVARAIAAASPRLDDRGRPAPLVKAVHFAR